MSGIVKSVKKVFKKVVSSPIGMLAVGAAVSFFTAGIGTFALGAMGASTGFLGSTLGTVLSYGISGAVAGAATSFLGGGDVMSGLLYGGLGGMVVGGVQSALGNYAGGAAGAEGAGGENGISRPPSEAAAGVQGNPANQIGSNPLPTGVATQTGAVLNSNAAAIPSNPAPGGGGFFDGIGSWVDRNPEIAGRMIEGAAKGGLEMFAGGADGEAAAMRAQTDADRLAFDRQQYGDLRNSYNTTGGMLPASGGVAPPPNSAPPAGTGQFRWLFNPQTRRIEPVSAPYTVAA